MTVFGPKGLNMKAQGNALGSGLGNDQSPERAAQSRFVPSLNDGKCFALSGQKPHTWKPLVSGTLNYLTPDRYRISNVGIGASSRTRFTICIATF